MPRFHPIDKGSAMFVLLLATMPGAAGADGDAAVRTASNRQIVAIAEEARQVIAVLEWFYVRHRACPQPARPIEMAGLEGQLGDGYSVEPQGQFVAIRGISMTAAWLYYTSPLHPDHCTLWRKLGWDPALIWRRSGNITGWAFDPGDGRAERPFKLVP
jgi:hypothetical protein